MGGKEITKLGAKIRFSSLQGDFSQGFCHRNGKLCAQDEEEVGLEMGQLVSALAL